MNEPVAEQPAQSSGVHKAVAFALAPALLCLLVYGALVLAGALPVFHGLHMGLFVAWPITGVLLGAVLARKRGVLSGLSALIGLLIVLVCFYVNFRAVKVEGESMLPTLQPGDVLLMDLTVRPGQGDRFGIFVLDVEGEAHNPLIKRLVGLPGETVDVRFGRVFADEMEVFPRDGTAPDSWNETRPAHARFYDGGRKLGDDRYFFLGDNPPDSRDSRAFGGVPAEEVEGRVIWSLRGSHGFGRME
ncbi:MAG: signal peptidase I [Planctomycetes bacterium]|nr:signal peptidase I [Planctomycetota bacterium]